MNKEIVFVKSVFVRNKKLYQIKKPSKWISPAGATTEPRGKVFNNGFGMGEKTIYRFWGGVVEEYKNQAAHTKAC